MVESPLLLCLGFAIFKMGLKASLPSHPSFFASQGPREASQAGLALAVTIPWLLLTRKDLEQLPQYSMSRKAQGVCPTALE